MKRERDNNDIYDEHSDTDAPRVNFFRCKICGNKYKNMKTLKQHMQSHMVKQKCDLCDKSYVRTADLHIHKRKIHGLLIQRTRNPRTFTCDLCNKVFERKYHLQRHRTKVHHRDSQRRNPTNFACRHCESEFQNYENLFNHVELNHPLNQNGGRQATHSTRLLIDNRLGNNTENSANAMNQTKHTEGQTVERQTGVNRYVDETAIRNAVANRNIYPRHNERYDMLTFFAGVREQVKAYLESRVRQRGGIKWNLCVHVELQRDDGLDSTTSIPYFRSRTYMMISTEDLNEHNLNEAMQKMYASLEKYMREGSGWYVKRVLKLEIHTVVYKPVSGSSYIPLPKTLSYSGSILNIYNEDNKCFLYCLLASLHPAQNEREHAERYIQYEQELNMSGVSYPVTIPQIHKVENQNQELSINVFTFEDGSILPMRITTHTKRQHHVNLLWLKTEENSHYFLITNLNRFLSRTKTSRYQRHFCPYCLHGFTNERLLKEHRPYCSTHGAQKVELPIPGRNDILKFKEYEKTLKVPFVIYADFETINVEINTCMPNPEHSATTPKTKLEVCGFGYKVVCENEKYTKPTVVYRGPDASHKLIECLLEEQEKIEDVLSNAIPMDVDSVEHRRLFDEATHCYLCKKQFTHDDKTNKKIALHHSHTTGAVIGVTCSICNLQAKQTKFTCVIFHNLRNFDAHILCESLGHFKECRLKCIAQNSERYISFTLGNLRFLDSFQFLPSSLEALADDLAHDGLDAFQHLLSECETREDAELLCCKGVYPYEFMNCFDRFNDKELPARESFYSTIKGEHISVEDYYHAQKVFRHFNIQNLGDYHDLYLKTDVLLLCDVFESFRNVCMNQYELDACHFYTSAGLSWTSCLKMTDARLELLTDIDMVLMVEAGSRGGLSQISSRHCKANNPYLPDYDHSKPTSYIQYLDANNLYGWAMVQPLPVSDFLFLEESEIENLDISTTPECGDTGYILEVSLYYPNHLHDSHNCLPLAPEQKIIGDEQLSDYAKTLLKKLHGKEDHDPIPKRGKVSKLVATLDDKDHYVIHYRTLQLYLRLGMRIKTIHRVLQFHQAAWMKPYIDFNTEKRKKASSTFQKRFYKLMNVSVFGKTMENVRRHKSIELIHSDARLKKVSSKATYKHATIFSEDLVAAEMYRVKVNLCKPSYCGMSILGAFLIPYAVMILIEGVPLFYLELAMGQRLRKGAYGAWNQVSPYLGGLGIASAVVSFNLALYYNTIMAWCLVYLVHSFQDPLPWSVCPSVHHGNTTVVEDECQRSGPTTYFWYRETLQIAPSIDSSPGFNLKLAAALLVAWVLVYLCMIKGIKSSGKVVYVTATFPYLVLVIFFFRGITLKGSSRGLAYLFIPEWERLLDPAVWLDAATQIFYSFGLAFGCLIALSSYNPVRSNFVQEAITVSIADFFTSIFTAVVVFSILGFKATVAFEECLERHGNHTIEFGQRIEPTNVTCNFKEFLEGSASGTGLAFIVFTEAINQFPVAQLWSVLFFLMLFTLGLDSMFGTLEGALTSINDMMMFPGLRKEILVGVTCLVSFLVSLAFAARTGPYVFDLYDSYCANIPLLVIAFTECVAVSYKYGLKNISDDVELMVGRRPSYLWLLCWRYIGPVAMAVILVCSIIEIINNGSMYKVWDSMQGVAVLTPWPWWCQVIAALLILMSLLWIPGVAICKYFHLVEWTEEAPAFFPIEELKEERHFKEKEPNWFEKYILGFKT